MSRPEKHIDWERVDELLEAGCAGTEVASALGMYPDTFYDRIQAKYGTTFSAYAQAKYAKGESVLREVQYLKACGRSKKGDNTMLTLLGKHRLGQKDNATELRVSQEFLGPVEALMSQLKEHQSARKIADSNSSSEPKSA